MTPGADFDVAIIGGSFAGLTAALQLGRASRRVAVIDAGAPRNRFSPAAHGVAGWDGVPPGEILARFRADLAAYPGVEFHAGRVTGVTGVEDSFAIDIASQPVLTCRRVILAHGVTDILPEIPGLAEHWGRRVLHCPYCHGYEVKDRALAVLATHPLSAHQAQLLRSDWSDRVTLLTNHIDGIDQDALADAKIDIDPRDLTAVKANAGGLQLMMADGATRDVAALFLAPFSTIAGTPAAQLGCLLGESPMSTFVRVGPMKQTSVPGVFAAGDLANPMPNVNFAVADGAMAGVAAHQSLVFPGFIEPLRPEAAPA